VSAPHTDCPCCSKAGVEEYAPADSHLIGDQRMTVRVAAIEVGAAACEFPGDVRARQADCARGRESVSEVDARGFDSIRAEGIAVLVAARQPGATAAHIPGNVGVAEARPEDGVHYEGNDPEADHTPPTPK